MATDGLTLALEDYQRAQDDLVEARNRPAVFLRCERRLQEAMIPEAGGRLPGTPYPRAAMIPDRMAARRTSWAIRVGETGRPSPS
jgi:hypothetical protein